MQWLSGLAVPLVFALVFIALRVFLPSRPRPDIAPPDDADRKRFHRLHLAETLALPVLTLLLTFILYRILLLLPVTSTGQDILFKGGPAGIDWLLPSLLLAMGISLAGMDVAMTSRLKGDVHRLRAFQSGVYGFDAGKVRKGMQWLTFMAGATLLILMHDYTFTVRRDKAVVDRFLSIMAEEYSMKDVSEVLTAPDMAAPDGSRRTGREYVVRMADGGKFSSLYLPGVTDANKDSLFALIAVLSGKPLTEKAVLDRADLR